MQQTELFNRVVLDANNGPLLIYTPKAALIEAIWASYRLSVGLPLELVLSEGRFLEFSVEQEAELRNRENSFMSKENQE